MYSLAKLSKLNRHTGQRVALLKSLVFSLFKHGYIFTTNERAKSIRGFVDKLINLAKKKDIYSTRRIVSFFGKKDILKNINKYLDLETIMKRNSGYCSLKKTYYRKGDSALVSCLRLIDYEK